MAEGQENTAGRGFGRLSLIAFFVLFAVFCLNVVIGKLAILAGWSRDWLLGDTAEFLALALSAVLLMIAGLARERARDAIAREKNADQ